MLRYVVWDVLCWYLFLYKTWWKVVVMRLKDKNLIFLIKTLCKALRQSNDKYYVWQVFEKNVTWSGCKITLAGFIYLSLLIHSHIATITIVECVLVHSYGGFYLPLNFAFCFAEMNVILTQIYSRNYHFLWTGST